MAKDFYIMKAFEPYYHVGLGEMVYSRQDLSRKLKEQGLVEVGTEDTRKIFKGMSKADIQEEARSLGPAGMAKKYGFKI